MGINKVKGGYMWGSSGKVHKSKDKAKLDGIDILMINSMIKERRKRK